VKSFSTSNNDQKERQLAELKKLFANCTSGKGLMSKVNKDLQKCSIQKQNNVILKTYKISK
jgi:hypothetical protein